MQLPLAIKRYMALMPSMGILPESILRGTDIELEMIHASDYYIDPEQCRIVVENMIRLGGKQGIGLNAGLSAPLPNLGAVGHVLLTCKTMREAYEPWRRFGEPLAGIVGKYRMSQEDVAGITFEFDSFDASTPLSIFYVEELLGMSSIVGHALAGSPVEIRQANFHYPEPDYADRYRALLKCPIRFNAQRTTITLGRTWVDHATYLGDEELNKICVQHCEDVLQRLSGHTSISSSLRALFLSSKNEALPALNEAAVALKMSSRTMRRRLDQEGTSFQKQLTLFRAERAKEYFRHGLSTKQVSGKLGYNDPSAFRSAFKDWTGLSVNDYRLSVFQDLAETQ